MKTLKYLAVVCFLSIFVACSSDDDNNNNDDGPAAMGTFTYNGKTYQLTTGVIENEGEGYGDYDSIEYLISFTTSELGKDDEGDFYPTDDKFSIIDFSLFSENGEKPKVGTYHFDSDNNVDFTFDYVTALINVEVDWDEVDPGAIDLDDPNVSIEDLTSAKSGTIEIHESGETYDIDFEFTMYNNKKIKGNYTGDLHMYDDEIDGRPTGRTLVK